MQFSQFVWVVQQKIMQRRLQVRYKLAENSSVKVNKAFTRLFKEL